ncbi:MAG: glutamyl-tRNA reductase [Spirochaetaceae bacterium]|jgi:glutamyl-tRNA reductase|nr:glutamyl-tRNA reductase [Spirochaetaceae bacterium]
MINFMRIFMAGIDYTQADVRTREVFAFTPHALFQTLEAISRGCPETGCIIISTCNRTEIYVSGNAPGALSPDRLLCEAKHISWEDNRTLLALRQGMDAAEHLFSLTAGLKSQIAGEQQILGQVKDALETARKAGSTEPALERLFLAAITCAKRIKTETAVNRADPSISTAAASLIMSRIPPGSPCLIIGNGVTGRAIASRLACAGYQVSMTLRRHNHAETIIPAGVKPLDYDARYPALPDYRAVVSATRSPHYTVACGEAAKFLDSRERLFLDLAVPRDFDPALGGLAGITLLDIDCLAGGLRRDAADWQEIQEILGEELREFALWHAFRDYTGGISAVQESFAAEVVSRLERHIGRLGIEAEAAGQLREQIGRSARRVAGKMLFGLRESLDPGLWRPCFSALQEAVLRPAPGPGKRAAP